MPLSKIQSDILRLLAAHRNPESYVAGAVPINRDTSRFSDDIYADLATVGPIDVGEVARRLRAALEDADAFARAMPVGKEGLLFLKDGQPVQPDPANLEKYLEHAGSRRGHWPSSPEIGSAMLERD